MERDELEPATWTLHRLTSYTPDRPWDKPADDPRVRQDIVSCDEERRTPPVKEYDGGLPRTALPRELPVGHAAALAVLGGWDAAEPGTANLGTAEPGTANLGTAELGTAELGTANPGTAELGTAELGTANLGTAEPDTANLGTANLGTAEPDTANLGTAKPSTAKPSAADSIPVVSTPADALPLNLADLSRVLFLSAGVVRTQQRDFGTVMFRAAGSAGNRFPLELYVAIPEIPGSDLPPGVHWYDPVDHALVRIAAAPADSGGAPTVVVTGVPWRTGWRYAERGYRHIYWDAGTMLSQLLALGDSGGHAPSLFTRFPDAAVSDLVGADRVHEWPLALVTLGGGGPSITAAGPAVAGLTDADPAAFPLITAAQHAGDMDHLGKPWDFGAATPVAAPSTAPTLDDVIVKRGSQRRMDPSHGLPLETLETCMTVALRGIDIPHWVAVHDVTGLPSGLYRWPQLENPLRSEQQEAMRAELQHVCLGQTLGRDAAFVVIAATDVSELPEREYREAQLAAGIVEGRLHLAAYALGASASGMTFLDSEIPALLGDPETPHGLIFTCVGVPGNTSKPAGPPGAPTEIRRVTPRE